MSSDKLNSQKLEDWEKAKRYKDERMLLHIMEKMNKDIKSAALLWYGSKTREYFDRHDMYWVSDTRMLDELEMELKNDPGWMKGLFE